MSLLLYQSVAALLPPSRIRHVDIARHYQRYRIIDQIGRRSPGWLYGQQGTHVLCCCLVLLLDLFSPDTRFRLKQRDYPGRLKIDAIRNSSRKAPAQRWLRGDRKPNEAGRRMRRDVFGLRQTNAFVLVLRSATIPLVTVPAIRRAQRQGGGIWPSRCVEKLLVHHGRNPSWKRRERLI